MVRSGRGCTGVGYCSTPGESMCEQQGQAAEQCIPKTIAKHRSCAPCTKASCCNAPIQASHALPPQHCLNRPQCRHAMKLHAHLLLGHTSILTLPLTA